VVRVSNDNELNSSAPCKDCYEKMLKLGVKYIIYSNKDGSITKIKCKNYNPKTISLGRKFINNGYKLVYRQ
jgi:deoxycytidylate deaminase